MEGTILGWNTETGEGVIKGESGERYQFKSSDWKSDQKPKPNTKVDFVVSADAAVEIYALGGSNQMGETLQFAKNGFGHITEQLASNTLFKRLTEHGLFNVVAAALVFVALILSIGDYQVAQYYHQNDISVTSGFGGFIYVAAALAFVVMAILGLKPLIVRILGAVLALILVLHLGSVLMIAVEAFMAREPQYAFMLIAEQVYLLQTMLLFVALLLVIVATILPKVVNPNFATEKELLASGSNAAVSSNADMHDSKEQNKAYITYALLASGGFTFIGGIIGLIMAYMGRKNTDNELYKDHYRFIIRTFWFSMLWAFISLITALLVVGIILALVVTIWFWYRVIKGWLRLANRQMMYVK